MFLAEYLHLKPAARTPYNRAPHGARIRATNIIKREFLNIVGGAQKARLADNASPAGDVAFDRPPILRQQLPRCTQSNGRIPMLV